MNISYGNETHSSVIKPDEAAAVLEKCVAIINEMIELSKKYENKCKDITNNWKGGGKTKESACYSTLAATDNMYASMMEAISYATDLMNAVMEAGNQLYNGYDKNHILASWK